MVQTVLQICPLPSTRVQSPPTCQNLDPEGGQQTFSNVPEGHHPTGTTLRESLRGKLPLESQRVLRGLCGGLSRVLRGSAGLRGVLQWSTGVSEGSDPMLVTLRTCWNFSLPFETLGLRD